MRKRLGKNSKPLDNTEFNRLLRQRELVNYVPPEMYLRIR